jgi:hypothetical protein
MLPIRSESITPNTRRGSKFTSFGLPRRVFFCDRVECRREKKTRRASLESCSLQKGVEDFSSRREEDWRRVFFSCAIVFTKRRDWRWVFLSCAIVSSAEGNRSERFSEKSSRYRDSHKSEVSRFGCLKMRGAFVTRVTNNLQCYGSEI